MQETGRGTNILVCVGGGGVVSVGIWPLALRVFHMPAYNCHSTDLPWATLNLATYLEHKKQNNALLEVPCTVKYFACIVNLPVLAAALPRTLNY